MARVREPSTAIAPLPTLPRIGGATTEQGGQTAIVSYFLREPCRAALATYSCVLPSGIRAPLKLTPSSLASVRIARDNRDSERSAPVRSAPVRSAPNRSAPERFAPFRFVSRITA